jgi:hypothetical protein
MPSPRAPALLFGSAILLSAFLLFEVEPLIAKLILPWFGGSAAVWTACLLFFQLTLLAGYAYAHWLDRRRAVTQRILHLALLALSLLWLPILPSPRWNLNELDNPLWRILGLLTATVGLPWLLLSATGPLLQSWYSRSNRSALPYRYFAISNAGSMIGLLSYPIFIEPYLTSRQQAWTWSIAYCAFAIMCAAVAWCTRRAEPQAAPLAIPQFSECLLWVALAACPSALLLAVTSHLTENIAAIPFLWVLPLSLYLLSFILCFDSDRWYRRWLFTPLAAISLPVTAWLIFGAERISDIRLLDLKSMIALLSAATFVLFVVCHGELARRRPAPAHLTVFYLMIAAGGALGGLFIGLAAPYCFNALYDLPIILSLIGFLFLYLIWIARGSSDSGLIWFTLAAGFIFGFAGIFARETWKSFAYARLLVRNFYGSLVVYDNEMPRALGPVRVLRNGMIDHGEQFLWPQNRRYPTTYYAHDSGVGRALTVLMKQGPIHAGVIGLGAGTLAAYGRPADRYDFYEINPNVAKIATSEFTFLRDCPAAHRIVPGDARLSLQRESPQHFDLLVLDAFSADSIPVHLLTREAFALYWRHLKPDGALAVHVSNKYLSLAPVVALAAAERRKQAMLLSYGGNETNEESSSDWALVTSRPGFFELPVISPLARQIEPVAGLRTWTDQYSSLYRILR